MEVAKLIGANVQIRTLEERLARKGTVMVDVSISYPECGDSVPDSSRREFNRYYLGLAQSHLRTARGPAQISALRHYHRNSEAGVLFRSHIYTQKCEVTYNTLPIISLICDTFRLESGSHGVTERRADTWDMTAGHTLSLRELFKPGYDYRKTIFDYIGLSARRQNRTEAQDTVDEMRKRFNERDFYLSRRGISVFFPAVGLDPYEDEIPVYTVPFAEFEGITL